MQRSRASRRGWFRLCLGDDEAPRLDELAFAWHILSFMPYWLTMWHKEPTVTEKTLIVELMVGPQGRVVIPANLRRAWQLTTGEVLMAHLENDRLILEKPAQIAQRAKTRYAGLLGQPSLVDELIAERRRAAELEEGQ